MSNNLTVTLADHRLVDGAEKSRPVDLGGYGRLHIAMQVHATGEGAIIIEHAAEPDDAAFEQLCYRTVAAESVVVSSQSSFLRYVRYRCECGGSPMVSVHIVAKER